VSSEPLPAAVRVHRVEHQAPHDAVVEAAVGRALVGVAAGVALPGRPPGGAEVLAHVIGAGHRRARRVGRDRDPRPAGQLQQRVDLGGVEPAQRVRRIDVAGRGHELHRAGREVVQPASGGHRALEHVVVVAVHRVPGQAEPGGPERPPRRRQHAGHLGEPVTGLRQVRPAAVGMPVPLVLDAGPGHALVTCRVAGIRAHPAAVEQVDIGPQLVALAVVRRVHQVTPSTANGVPPSTTSGARLWPLSCWTAVISCPLEPSGLASVIWMWYSLLKSLMIVP
jgi:hypothetical protein